MNRSRLRWGGLILLGVMGAGLMALHFRYPLPYVYRVLAYRDSDFGDIHRFPSRQIAAPGTASELPVRLTSQVAELAALHPDIEDLSSFLQETETTAFLVVHEGQLIAEHYLLGHDAQSVQNTFSVSKSLTSALVGLAVRDGLIDLQSPITQALPELGRRDPRFHRITLENLLNMRSGIRYSSEVAFPFVNADDPLIYYHQDLQSVLLERTTIAAPPGSFQYNNYNPPLVGLTLGRVTGLPPAQYLERELWEPMGAAGAAGWTVDEHGVERMESGFFASARDLARFGLLYLNDGVAGGRQVVPRAWVFESTELSEPMEQDEYDGRRWVYRAGWWIVPRPEGRSDFTAIGRYGQFIYVSPQYDAVFVRNGPGRGDWGDRDWTGLFYSLAEGLGGSSPEAAASESSASSSSSWP